MFSQPTPFSPRPIRAVGLLEHRGWTLKRYDIHIQGDPLDQAAHRAGCAFALALLPLPGETARRPGVGFIICHQGASVDYLILNWWDNHNELFQRICIRPRPDGAWETGEGRGSFCVWDAEVIWQERQAYVHHVLSESPDIAGYLGDTAWVSASRGVAAHGS